MPLSHYTVSQGGLVFMKKATELSKGRIQFKHFPACQLGKGKDMLQLAQRGVAEIVNIGPGLHNRQVPSHRRDRAAGHLRGLLQRGPGLFQVARTRRHIVRERV